MLLTPFLHRLHVPCVIKLVLLNVIIKRCKFGVVRHSHDFRVFKRINICCVVFVTTLRLSVNSIRRCKKRKLHFDTLAFLLPFIVNNTISR